MNACNKYLDTNSKYMNLLVHDMEILEKYNEIWNRIKNVFKKEFDSEPVRNDKYIKTEISLFKMSWYITSFYFYGNKIPKGNERYTC